MMISSTPTGRWKSVFALDPFLILTNLRQKKPLCTDWIVSECLLKIMSYSLCIECLCYIVGSASDLAAHWWVALAVNSSKLKVAAPQHHHQCQTQAFLQMMGTSLKGLRRCNSSSQKVQNISITYLCKIYRLSHKLHVPYGMIWFVMK